MLLDNMPHKATARRRKRTSDGMGGFIDTFTEVVFADKECWRQRATEQDVQWWQSRSVNVTNRVFFNEDPLVDENCVVDIDGWRYDVLSYAEPDDSAGLGVLWRLMVNRFRRAA